MEQQPTINAHNKEEFPPAHNTMDTSLIKRFVLLFGIVLLCGCNFIGFADSNSYSAGEIGASEYSIMNDTSNSLLA